MTRKECLDKAAECVLKDRQNVYGKPEDCFGMIARMWGAYLGVCVSAPDVAAMMALLKIARFRHNPSHEDNAVDCAGYAACMVECATAWEREGEDEAAEFDADHKFLESVFGKYKTEADVAPEFKPGDRVQYRATLPSVSDSIWVDAEYVRHLPDGRGHIVQDKKIGSVLVGDKDIRPAPKAEGCEALVEKDAPQTPAELYDKIIASNPATFGRPRTPTGEELAEMAEEEKHG